MLHRLLAKSKLLAGFVVPLWIQAINSWAPRRLLSQTLDQSHMDRTTPASTRRRRGQLLRHPTAYCTAHTHLTTFKHDENWTQNETSEINCHVILTVIFVHQINFINYHFCCHLWFVLKIFILYLFYIPMKYLNNSKVLITQLIYRTTTNDNRVSLSWLRQKFALNLLQVCLVTKYKKCSFNFWKIKRFD